MSSKCKISPLLIIVPMFLEIFSLSLIMVPTQQWILLYICKNQIENKSLVGNWDWDNCRQDATTQALSVNWGMAFSLASNIPSLVAAPVLGSLSDYFGRKPIIYIPLISSLLLVLSFIAIDRFNLSLWVFLVVKFLLGFTGGWSVMMITALAYMADISSVDNRTSKLLYLEICLIISFTFGPVLGGYIIRVLGMSNLLQITAILLGIAILFTIFILPETKIIEIDDKAAISNQSILQISKTAFKNSFEIFYSTQSCGRMLLLSVLFANGTGAGTAPIFFLWAALKFGWDSLNQGFYILTFSVSRLFYLMAVFPLLKYFFRKTINFDFGIIRFSLFIQCISKIAMTFVTQDWMLLAIPSIDGISALAVPTVRGVLSAKVSKKNQASLFSGLQVIFQLGQLFGTVLIPIIWANTVGTPFVNTFIYVESSIYGLSFICALFLCEKLLRDDSKENNSSKDIEVSTQECSSPTSLEYKNVIDGGITSSKNCLS